MARLYVLSVLYEPEVPGVARFLRGVQGAARYAIASRSVDSVHLALGDCSPEPISPPSGQAVEHITLRYIHFQDNLGHSGGCNKLVELTDGLAPDDVLVFLNPDTVVAPDSLALLAQALTDPTTGVVDARQIPFEHPKAFDATTGEESWASGACMAMTAAVFQRVGGFDAKYFWSYCNDVDISWRIRATGLAARNVPESVVFHDKRMDADGAMQATATQDFFSTLGRLHLAHRYGHPEVARQTISWIRRAGSAEHRRALEVYLDERSRGDLPPLLDGGARVAQFVGQEYAEHRF